MTDDQHLPQAARPFVAFPTVLRAHGFAVAPEQTTTFLQAIELLGPRGMADIHRAARATLAPPVERHTEFDALFRTFFMGQTVAAPVPGEDDDEMRVQDADTGVFEPEVSDEINEAGGDATATEALSQRQFEPEPEQDALRRLAREADAHLPRRRVRRRVAARGGNWFDLRKALRQAARQDGDVIQLPRLKRKHKQRPVLLLIDVSGSMKVRTDAHLRFAHTLAQSAEQVEVFTFGTRLTRITRALKLKRQDQALAATSSMVADWDGGTRIGDALLAFLSVPRFVGLARSALTLILSDGLERGDHTAMTEAVIRLSRSAWRLHWLTPLATGPDFKPETAALKSVAPYLDELADASSVERVCAHILELSQGEAA